MQQRQELVAGLKPPLRRLFHAIEQYGPLGAPDLRVDRTLNGNDGDWKGRSDGLTFELRALQAREGRSTAGEGGWHRVSRRGRSVPREGPRTRSEAGRDGLIALTSAAGSTSARAMMNGHGRRAAVEHKRPATTRAPRLARHEPPPAPGPPDRRPDVQLVASEW
jgi:hypothetical protein